MTEKTEYITASIELLEKRDELNSDELAVLCNLKKFMYQSSHQPTFEVGEYYVDEEANFIFKVLEINDGTIKVLELDTWFYKLKEGAFNLDSTFAKEAKPATAEQIKMFKVAEAIERSGLTPEQHKQMISDGKINIGVWSALQTTAEELQEVENNE